MENIVKDLRTSKGWTQAELAEKLGVSRQTIVAIEKEKYDPSLPLAFQFSAIFARSIESIFIYKK